MVPPGDVKGAPGLGRQDTRWSTGDDPLPAISGGCAVPRPSDYLTFSPQTGHGSVMAPAPFTHSVREWRGGADLTTPMSYARVPLVRKQPNLGRTGHISADMGPADAGGGKRLA